MVKKKVLKFFAFLFIFIAALGFTRFVLYGDVFNLASQSKTTGFVIDSVNEEFILSLNEVKYDASGMKVSYAIDSLGKNIGNVRILARLTDSDGKTVSEQIEYIIAGEERADYVIKLINPDRAGTYIVDLFASSEESSSEISRKILFSEDSISGNVINDDAKKRFSFAGLFLIILVFIVLMWKLMHRPKGYVSQERKKLERKLIRLELEPA